jgi:hypothetical protein
MGVDAQTDFALAFGMVHEVPDPLANHLDYLPTLIVTG